MSGAITQMVRGPLLVPREDGRVDYFADGALAADQGGTLRFVGAWNELEARVAPVGATLVSPASVDRRPSGDASVAPTGERTASGIRIRHADGVMLPPLVDLHIHIPQHPIRGHFVDGVPDDVPGGRLLAGLRRNVFPAEARCRDLAVARQVVEGFALDTLSHGVVGGCAYMMVSPRATDVALSVLPDTWQVGMVLMNQNSPDDLTTSEPTLEHDLAQLARRHGKRVIVTDRFAVAVDSRLRRRASAIAAKLGLRTQTHLNEQPGEKRLVERELYPDAQSYTHVYLDDGLLDHRCILAHCIHMRPEEWDLVRDTGSVVAHCPSSNLLLGSGVMPLDEVVGRKIPYAIATDVGASPTVSMLAEMKRFLMTHADRSTSATPSEALFRATLAPAQIMGIADRVGSLEVGKPMSFIEVRSDEPRVGSDVDPVIRALLPLDVDQPEPSVTRVTLGGRVVFDRGGTRA